MSLILHGTNGIEFPDTTDLASSPIGGFKNKIINGNFDIWQRGASGFSATGYSADRWYSNTTNITIAQTALVGIGGVYAMRYTTTSATNAAYLEQALERQIARQLRGKTVTLSGYAVCSTGTVSAQLYLSKNSTPDTRSGGSWSAMDGNSPKNITITTTPTQFSVTCVVPNDGTAEGILAGFFFTNASNGVNVDFYGIQLEEGSVATPFETRSVGQELALCQRYYWRQTADGINSFFASGQTFASTQQNFGIQFPVQMRVAPSLAHSTASNFNVLTYAVSGTVTSLSGSITIANADAYSAFIYTALGLAAAGGCLLVAANSSAYIEWTGAEL